MRRQRGFTLLEVMISLTILSFMMIIAWSTLSSSVRAQRTFEQIQERNHEVRIALARMVRDVSSAYLSDFRPSGSSDARTMLIGKPDGTVDELRFTSFAHQPLWADANESEQTLIAYFAAPDSEDRSKTNLVRRESRRLSNEDWEQQPAKADVLVRDVKRVELEYYDWKDNEWKERWNTTSADAEFNRLPYRVRIKITLVNERGEDFVFTTQARVQMQQYLKPGTG